MAARIALLCVVALQLCGVTGAAAAFPRRDDTTASFPHYPLREVYALTGEWDFAFLNYTEYNATADPLPDHIDFSRSQQVPAAWDAAWGTGLQYSRGAGVYRTKVSIEAGRPAALHFEGCSLFCRVFVDGVLLHNHSLGGFTPFWVEVPPTAKATSTERTVVVLASNVFSSLLTPTQMEYYDFYQYGGIIREATLHVLPPTNSGPSIKRVTATPLASAAGKGLVASGKVDVVIQLRGLESAARGAGRLGSDSVTLGLCWDQPASSAHCTDAVSHSYTPGADGEVTIPALSVPDPKLWGPDPASANLHTLTVLLYGNSQSYHDAGHAVVPAAGAAQSKSQSQRQRQATGKIAIDSCQIRFGLRVVKAQGREILVNGKPTKLRGFNRHDMYPQYGPSMLVSQYDSDLALIQKGLSGNFIRGAHYPQDPRFLDRCDELGVLIWEEALAWGNRHQSFLDPVFMAAQLGTANAMLDRDTNHPSVILWGFFNEGESDHNESKPAYKAMADTFRGRDPSRLVTWADNRLTRSVTSEYADVVSFNFYPGWYDGPADQIKATWAGLAAQVAALWPDKPFIISETGAGGIDHNHSANASRWSEEYQVVVDTANAQVAMDDRNITGIALWQFCDIKVDQKNSSTGRPGGINNKGLVDRWRKPKLAATAVERVYKSASDQV